MTTPNRVSKLSHLQYLISEEDSFIPRGTIFTVSLNPWQGKFVISWNDSAFCRDALCTWWLQIREDYDNLKSKNGLDFDFLDYLRTLDTGFPVLYNAVQSEV